MKLTVLDGGRTALANESAPRPRFRVVRGELADPPDRSAADAAERLARLEPLIRDGKLILYCSSANATARVEGYAG